MQDVDPVEPEMTRDQKIVLKICADPLAAAERFRRKNPGVMMGASLGALLENVLSNSEDEVRAVLSELADLGLVQETEWYADRWQLIPGNNPGGAQWSIITEEGEALLDSTQDT